MLDLVGHRHHGLTAVLGDRRGGGGHVHAGTDALMHLSNLVTARIHRVAIGGDEIDVGKHHVEREVAALDEKTGRHPAAPITPTGDGRRVHQTLAQGRGQQIEVGRAGHAVQAELVIGGDHQFHRALDPCRDRRRTVEIARQEQRLEENGEVVIAGLQAFGKGAAQLR